MFNVFIGLSVMIYAIVFLTMKRLCSKGTSPKLRRLVARRHLLYMAVFTLRIIQFSSDLFSDHNFEASDQSAKRRVWNIVDVFLNSLGLLLLVVILTEPYVLSRVKFDLLRLSLWFNLRKLDRREKRRRS
jgi:glycopeptide antibiotics resistance protein